MSRINITGAEAELILVALNHLSGDDDIGHLWDEELRALLDKMAHHYEISQD